MVRFAAVLSVTRLKGARRLVDGVSTVGRPLGGAGFDPVESLVSFAGVGAAPRAVFASRGWADEDWDAAAGRLVERGWLNEDGTATDAGHAGRDEVERMTDELAAPAYRALGAEQVGRFAQLVMPVTMAVVQTGLLPRQSTLGLSR